MILSRWRRQNVEADFIRMTNLTDLTSKVDSDDVPLVILWTFTIKNKKIKKNIKFTNRHVDAYATALPSSRRPKLQGLFENISFFKFM